jgi:membrane-associated protein
LRVTTIIDWIKWLIGLAHPENLRMLVDLGPWWVPYLILTAIIFSETGLLVGFFLPGDSLLFAAGFLASPAGEQMVGTEMFDIVWLNVLLIAAAVLGDAVNYYVGKQMGDHVFEKGRVRFIKHKHLMAAKHFYERHGGKAIVLARFAPIVRTFTPFVAGVAEMSYRKFAVYNIIGGVAWVISMTTAGYFLGRIEWIQKHFEIVVLLIIAISVLPMVIHALKAWWENRTALKVE